MYVDIMPAGRIALPGASNEAKIILRSVRSCILQDTDDFLYSSVGIDWRELHNTAVRNKLAVLVLRGLNKCTKEIPSNLRVALEDDQNATVKMNSVNLVTMRHIIPILELRGLNAVVFKGPIAQKMVHGDFFSKPSSDLDLLVFSSDYDKASRLIASNGFALAKECTSPWWSVFLGEQHFLSLIPSRATIDLHYRTQQPGSPAPRDGQLFMSKTMGVSVGSTQIRTLSKTNTCLLSCMSLVKALFQREPAGGHVCDIAANIRDTRPDELKQLFDDAVRQGLRNTLLLGLQSSGLLFGIRGRFEKSRDESVLRDDDGGSSDMSDANLLRMILRPWSTEIRWPRRSRMLWDLCDNKAAYLRAISWKISGDLCRRIYQSPRHHPVTTHD